MRSPTSTCICSRGGRCPTTSEGGCASGTAQTSPASYAGATFAQAGSDFLYKGRKIECWLREAGYVAGIIDECQRGIVKQDLVTWTVMGFYNHCALSDLRNMVPVDDPSGLLARWKAEVSAYPPKLRAAIIARHLNAARFWPDNFHYKSAVERCDVIYTTGIVHQVVHNLIQVIFALNETYFPGDKKLETALAHLPLQPPDFAVRVRRLLSPDAPAERALLSGQREALCQLLNEVQALIPLIIGSNPRLQGEQICGD